MARTPAPILGLALAGFVGAVVPVLSSRADDVRSEEFFEVRIRPVLAGTCFRCHGGQKVGGGLRVDTREALLKGGESGPAIDPDRPTESLLVRAIRREDEVSAMPPDRPLSPREVEDLRAWVGAGAPWPKAAPGFRSGPHWAFRPVRATAPPVVKDSSWARTGVDRYILARMESDGRRPAAQADRRTLLRRATYDLTGLPPTPAEASAFEADDGPGAFERVVDRLLDSPRYGEHWGRHWLDVVRYADTAGENTDHPVPQAWRYRNWVIRALNDDMPYDRFIREQVAGDLLARGGPPEEAAGKIVATGFLAIARRFGHEIDRDMHLTYADVIDTLGKSVLGLTLGCCRCHDHKYDPLTARDYYGLYGIFESTRFAYPGCEPSQQPRDLVPLPPPGEAAERSRRIDASRARPEASRPAAAVAYAVVDGVPHDARLQRRGEPTDPGGVVPRKFPDVLGGQRIRAADSSGRLDLARWLTDPSNPLTARVIANRVWHWHFGRGLVATPNDFGTRGEKPTHPELLDYLALRLVRSGWSLKALHREIVLSATYRESSGSSEPSPWYDAFARRRLAAEELRDTLLAVGGDLDETPGAAHPFPPESTWSFTQHAPFAAEYETRRRSVYLMQKRNRRGRFFALFDGPDPNESTARRDVTTVPTQALFFMNDPFLHEQAARFAGRIRAAASTDRLRADEAYRLLLGRPATGEERAEAVAFLRSYSAALADRPEGERAAASWEAYARVLLGCNEVLYVD